LFREGFEPDRGFDKIIGNDFERSEATALKGWRAGCPE
jgi:hypothetical protein